MKKKTYHIITIGCQMNKSDSERIAAYLENIGFNWIDDYNKADVVVTTTCGVRQTAEDSVYGLIPDIKKNNPQARIVLTGCLSNRGDVQKRLDKKVDVWLPISELPSLDEKLGLKTLTEESEEKSSLTGYLNIQPRYESSFSAFVPIGNGCDNFCSYCVVPYARGRETYRPAKEILNEVRGLVKRGYKEITLIAQNVNSYKDQSGGKNFKVYQFADLLKEVDNIPGDFWIRFATSHPKDMSFKLIKIIAASKKICPQIHLPAQAGDNEVLRRMNRKYTREHYLELLKKIRDNLNNKKNNAKDDLWQEPVAISTDIIVGFPGETKMQYKNTVKLFQEVGFDMAFIAQYSPRPGTASYNMVDDVLKEEKKRRFKELTELLRKSGFKNNQKYLNKIIRVLVEAKKSKYWFGKSAAGKIVRISHAEKKDGEEVIGGFVFVKIKKVANFSMEGELVEI